MHLSLVNLYNWRSYADAKFSFKPPTARRPLVLIGAMNGHGKTSFLIALYLGLFGRFGLRHVEGFGGFTEDDMPHYRAAIARFRRSAATPDEPTSIELVFSPTKDEADSGHDIHVIRRWFFTVDGKPRQGDAFETVELHIDGKPQRLATGLDAAHDRLERLLFPAHFMPAFFFDGEQAQTLIMNSGEQGIKRSVEVMFGTKVVDELHDQIKQYLAVSHNRLGGKRNVSNQQRALNQKLDDRERLDKDITDLSRQVQILEQKKTDLESEQRILRERLARLGGEGRTDIESLHSEVQQAEREKLAAESALTERAKTLGLSLAVSRLAPAITNRLHAEQTRETWEHLREGTRAKSDEVLRVAMPEPPETDDLLGHLSDTVRAKVRTRFLRALEQIYIPPPKNCAPDYLLGHAKGEMRERLLATLDTVHRQTSSDIRARARRLKLAREEFEDLSARRARLTNLPQELSELSTKLTDVGAQISEYSRQLGSLEREIISKRASLKDLNADIGRLQEVLAALGPEQKRIAVAERVYRSLDALSQELRPITLRRLQDFVTRHFVAIADKRYRGGEIEFPHGGAPVLKRYGQPDQFIEMMSGFERRSFGVAFSLALAEISQRRIPLVIDTPLGNADTEYRPRLLKAVTAVDLDQIIILTHDAEVTGPLFEQIESQVQQTFLVQYDRNRSASVVTEGAFFNGVGR